MVNSLTLQGVGTRAVDTFTSHYPGLGLLPCQRSRGLSAPWESFLLFLSFQFLWVSLKVFNHMLLDNKHFVCSLCFHSEWKKIVMNTWLPCNFTHILDFYGRNPNTYDLYLSSLSPGSTESRLTTIQQKPSPCSCGLQEAHFLHMLPATSLIECSYLKHTPNLMNKKWPCQTTMSLRDQFAQ